MPGIHSSEHPLKPLGGHCTIFHVQGLFAVHGGTGALPIIASSVRQAEAEPFVFAPNMAMVVQAHVGFADNSAGLFMADTWVTTEGAPRPLNRYRRELIRL